MQQHREMKTIILEYQLLSAMLGRNRSIYPPTTFKLYSLLYQSSQQMSPPFPLPQVTSCLLFSLPHLPRISHFHAQLNMRALGNRYQMHRLTSVVITLLDTEREKSLEKVPWFSFINVLTISKAHVL